MKIFISQFGHETNTFAADRTGEDRFHQYQWRFGQEIIDASRGGNDYLSGMLATADEMGAEIVPGFATFNVGGLITDEAYSTIKRNIVESLSNVVADIDGICLSLHGAAVSESVDDLELDLLKAIREITGPGMPIMATFDLHGNISADMVSLLNGVYNVKEYPHIDCAQAGKTAMSVLIRTIRGEISPCVAYRRIPMLVPCATASTFQEPAKGIKEYLKAYTEEHKLLGVSFFHGFPYADLAIAGASVIVNAEASQDQAEKAADELATYIWDKRHAFDADYLSVSEAMDQALAIEGKPVVINETSDNPGGGTPADGTHLLREMLKRDIPGSCFGFIYDPEFVELAEKTGVGGRVSGLLGGKTDKIHGDPIEVKDAYVKLITDGTYFTANAVQGYGVKFSIGKTARIVIGNVDIIVGSMRFQTMDDRIFLLNGINIADYKIVALKSSQHFRAFFEKVSTGIVTADPPGIHTANFSQLNYRKLKHPIYPLDKS